MAFSTIIALPSGEVEVAVENRKKPQALLVEREPGQDFYEKLFHYWGSS